MKQLYLYFVVLLALLLLPGGTDVGKLAPAEVVYVQSVGELVSIRTDMGNIGLGGDLEEAFEDLEKTTPGKVFLDTADYLLVDAASKLLLPELAERLKGDCRVCQTEGVADLSGAAAYLDAHPPGVKLEESCSDDSLLPVLTEIDERFCLKG